MIYLAFLVSFLGTLLHWWVGLLGVIVLGYFASHWKESALAGGTAMGLTWLIQSFYLDAGNEHIVSQRMSAVLGLDVSWGVFPVLFLVAFLLGFFAMASGLAIKRGFGG